MSSSAALTNFDKEMGANEPLYAPSPDFDGPVPKTERRITDPLSALLLLAAWGYFLWVGVWSVRNGNPDEVFYPQDYRGRICGVDQDVNGKRLPSLWHPTDILGNGRCVDECPSVNVFNPVDASELMCKDEVDLLGMAACLNNDGEVSDDTNTLIFCGGCMFELGTVQSKSNFCQPRSNDDVLHQINVAAAKAGASELMTEYQLYQNMPALWRFVQGAISYKQLLLGLGLGGAAFLGMVSLFLLQLPRTIAGTIWTSIFLLPICMAYGGYLFYTIAQDYSSGDYPGVQSDMNPAGIKTLACMIWIASGMIIVAVARLRRRIEHIIAIAKVAAISTRSIPETFISPIVQLVGYFIFLLFLCSFLVYLASTGTIVDDTAEGFGNEIAFASYQYSKRTINFFWFLVFIFLWTSEFILAMGRITLSTCFSRWYFIPDKEEGVDISLISSAWQSVCKHFGTAAFGAIAIGPVKVIRVPILWTQKVIKDFINAEGTCMDLLICSCQCCLFSLERFLKFVSKHAYVYTALFGHSYCKAAHEAYYIMGRNADCGAIEGIYNERILDFCNLCVVSITSTATLLALHASRADFFVIGTVTLGVGITTWFVVRMFTEMCGSAILTLLHCYLVDDEIFDHVDGTIFAPPELEYALEGGEIFREGGVGEEPDVEKGVSQTSSIGKLDQVLEVVSVEEEDEEEEEEEHGNDNENQEVKGVQSVQTNEEAEENEFNRIESKEECQSGGGGGGGGGRDDDDLRSEVSVDQLGPLLDQTFTDDETFDDVENMRSI